MLWFHESPCRAWGRGVGRVEVRVQWGGQRAAGPSKCWRRWLPLLEAHGRGLAPVLLRGGGSALGSRGSFPGSRHCSLPAGLAWVTAPSHGLTHSSQDIFPDKFSAPLQSVPSSGEEEGGRDSRALPTAKLSGAKVCPQALASCWHCQQMSPMTALRGPGSALQGAVGSCGSAGIANRICAEGGGLNPAPRKEEISADFLPCGC